MYDQGNSNQYTGPRPEPNNRAHPSRSTIFRPTSSGSGRSGNQFSPPATSSLAVSTSSETYDSHQPTSDGITGINAINANEVAESITTSPTYAEDHRPARDAEIEELEKENIRLRDHIEDLYSRMLELEKDQSAPIGRISVNRVATDRKSQRAHTYNSTQVPVNVKHECCWCRTAKESYDHDPIHCKRTEQYDMDSIAKFAFRKNLCHGCLQPGHSSYNCNRKRNRCTQCEWPHAELLPHTEVLPL